MKGLIAGLVVGLAGLAGLIVAWVPQSQPGVEGRLTVTNAYVRPPAAPTTTAAVYLAVHNGTGKTQTLQSIRTDFAASAVMHGSTMTVASFAVKAHSTAALRPGGGHVMADRLYSTLKAGQQVHLTLTFAPAGAVSVTATVVGLTDTVPSIPGASS